MNIQTINYSAAFTAGALLYTETNALLGILLSNNSEQLIAEEIKNNQLIQINSEASRKRVLQEIVKRFQNVSIDLWRQYEYMPENEMKLVLFYSCLKSYRLIFDFHFEVTLKRQNIGADHADNYFYRMKLDEIGMNDPEVDTWTEHTKTKTITVYQRILREAGLIKEGKLSPVDASIDFWIFFGRNRENWFLDACLLNPTRKNEVLKYCV